MQSNKEKLLRTIPGLFALCGTIREAAAHAEAEPAAAGAMKEDIAAGVRAAEAAAHPLCPEDAPAPAALDELAGLEGKQIVEFVNTWFSEAIGPFLLKQFQESLAREWQLTQKEAQDIAHWILRELPALPATRKNLLLETGRRCAASAPEFSWELMMQVMESMTPEEQKQRFPHWSGAPYRSGQHPQTELKCCPTCGGEGVPHLSAFSGSMKHYDTLFLPAKLWMRCKKCGNLYTRWFPTEFLRLGAAPKVLEPAQGSMAVRQVQATDLRIWCDILNKIRAYTDGDSLLEVGVGQGHLIAVALEMGYDVTAVELIEEEARSTADLFQLPVICGDFLHLAEDRQMDVITMGDVLEHLQRPMEGLKKAAALLKDGGVLWLSTPNFESSFSRMMKTFDPMWSEPYHITYFSRKGLLPLLEQVGFELLEYSVSNRYNGSMELLLRKKAQSR